MSKIERYQGNVQAFASSAQGIERTVFGETTQANDLTSQITAAFLRGWGIVGPSEHPSLEDFNGAMYALSQFIAYQHQAGIPEWHEEQEYYAGSVCTHSGVAYQSIEDANTGNEPPSAHWAPVITSRNGSEYFQSLNTTLTALATLAGTKDKMPYFSGEDTAALTALTAFAREILAQTDAAGVLSKLGLGELPDSFGSAASRNIGTGTNQIPDMNSFTALLASNGWEKLPSGRIRQWGRVASYGSGAGVSVTFPIPFPTACTGVFQIMIRDSSTSSGSGEVAYSGEPTLTGVQLYHGGSVSFPAFWFAEGY